MICYWVSSFRVKLVWKNQFWIKLKLWLKKIQHSISILKLTHGMIKMKSREINDKKCMSDQELAEHLASKKKIQQCNL